MFTFVIAAVHAGEPLRPHDLWSAWTFEPVTLVALGMTAGLYSLGLHRLWQAAGSGRGVRRRDAGMFVIGWALLAFSQISPLHAAGGVLFSAHMAQHELLMTVAAPLLVLGKPLVPFVWALSPRWRRVAGRLAGAAPVASTWRAVSRPVAAFLVHGLAIWVWHLPSLYDATVRSEAIHAAQHVSFLLSALLFWWVVLASLRARGRVLMSVAILFATVLHTGALGALLALTSRLIYAAYATTSAAWGLSAVDDQQLGGLIMWVPGSLAYVIVGLVLTGRMLRDPERRVVRHSAHWHPEAVPSGRRIRIDVT